MATNSYTSNGFIERNPWCLQNHTHISSDEIINNLSLPKFFRSNIAEKIGIYICNTQQIKNTMKPR